MSNPIILLSSFSEEQRRKLTCLVEKLGGRVLPCVVRVRDGQGYDQRCTHVVVGAILSTEKLLAGAIAGKWVVSPKYIECSYKAKKWLEAERFVVRSMGSGNLKKLSEVPTRWLSFRKQNGSQGPFSSWRVLLALSDADKIRYKRLLQAGGAHVISDKPPYVWSLKRPEKLTFVFTNKELFITVMSLHSRGIPCIHPDYVKDYIIQYHQPDVNKYRANVYSHPVKKPVTCGYRKITSYIFTNHKLSEATVATSKRRISVRDKNTTHLPSCTGKVDGVKQGHHCLSTKAEILTVSIPLNKILLKRSRDPVIDLTIDDASPSVDCVASSDCVILESPTDCVMSQAPGVCVMSQPPNVCVTSQPPGDCVASQPPNNCVMSQPPSDCMPPSDCVISQPPGDHVMSQLPNKCVVSQPSIDFVSSQTLCNCVTSQLSNDHDMQPPTGCVTLPSTDHATDCLVLQIPSNHVSLQAYNNDDTFQSHCTDKNTGQAAHDEVLATRLRFSSEAGHIKEHSRKRKRKCVSLADFPQQKQQQVEQQCNNSSNRTEEKTEVVSKVNRIDHLPVMNVMLHQRGLWTTKLMQQYHNNQLAKTSVEALIEGYLSDHQSMSRGLNCCHSLFTSCVPSAGLLYQLTNQLMSDQLEDTLISMAAMTLNKLLLLHPPHSSVARQQYCKLFDLLGGSYSEYRKWEGLVQGIINVRPQLLQYLTDIIVLDYHRWLLLSNHAAADQPLLHKIMWDNRSCDTVSRPVKKLSHHFAQLLDSYHDNKYPHLESLCYLLFLTGLCAQSNSSTPSAVPAAPPPHLQAAQLGSSVHVRECVMSRVKSCHNVDDYIAVLQLTN